jgi:predicted aldo/keto reductase-like oxidoreductase
VRWRQAGRSKAIAEERNQFDLLVPSDSKLKVSKRREANDPQINLWTDRAFKHQNLVRRSSIFGCQPGGDGSDNGSALPIWGYHIDTAASYGDAELRLGPWMARARKDFFLASKTGERTYQKAKESIQRSLERLQTDHLDLIQLHAVIEDEEWNIALGPGGALEAAVEARQQGLVHFIGITSHTLRAPMIHQRSLEKFAFDSVLLPYNFMLMQNPTYAADFEALFALAQAKNAAVQLIKTAQRRPWNDQPHFAATWYEPFTNHALDLAIHWAMGRPGTFINTAGDIHILPNVLEAASQFDQVPTDAEMQAMLQSQTAVPLWE